MASLIPSIPPADGSRPGLLTHLAQVIGGVKTFAAAVIFSISVQVGLLFNTNGTGASDRVIQVGTSQTFAAANATAKVFSVWYGLGGAETEHLTLTKNGLYFNGYPNSSISCSGSWLQLGVLPVRADSYFYSLATSTAFYSPANGAFSAANVVRLWSEQAQLSTDVAVKLGCLVADGTVNVGTKLFSVRTGLGGTEVEYLAVTKTGLGMTGILGVGSLSPSGAPLQLTGSPASAQIAGVNKPLFLYAAGGSGIAETIRLSSQRGDAGLKCATIGTESATPSNDAVLAQFAKSIGTAANDAANGTAMARVMASGRFDQSGSDSSGAPGNATIDKPIGISAIAAGASSVTITNSLVTASSHISISPKNRDATCKELIWSAAAGSFTVTGTANATAALAFSWEVKGLI